MPPQNGHLLVSSLASSRSLAEPLVGQAEPEFRICYGALSVLLTADNVNAAAILCSVLALGTGLSLVPHMGPVTLLAPPLFPPLPQITTDL